MKILIRSVWVLIIILSIWAWYLINEVQKPVFINITINEVQTSKPKCEDIIKKLKIKNNCEEIKKIVNAFDNDPVFVATILHESNFNRMAVNKNKNGTVDKGVMQLNNRYFKVNGDIEYTISQGKKCLKENGMECWVSYKTGAYKKRLLDATQLINSLN